MTDLVEGLGGADVTVMWVVEQVGDVCLVGNLLAHDFVRIGGRRVGQVQEIDVGRDGNPRVRLQLDPGTKLPRDTKVMIRSNGLLGARYVQLIPGRSREMLDKGATIRGGPDAYTLGLPEAIATFDDRTRAGLGTMRDTLGVGVRERGPALNETIEQLDVGQRQFRSVAQAIRARGDATERLLPSLASATAALERTRPQVRPRSQKIDGTDLSISRPRWRADVSALASGAIEELRDAAVPGGKGDGGRRVQADTSGRGARRNARRQPARFGLGRVRSSLCRVAGVVAREPRGAIRPVLARRQGTPERTRTLVLS